MRKFNTPAKDGEEYSVRVPFDGFYNSVSDSAIDWIAERLFSRDNGEVNAGLLDHAFTHLRWQEARELYAREYLHLLGKDMEITMRFDHLDSPRSYNYGTDRIFAWIPQEQLIRILGRTPFEVMTYKAEKLFTPRSGFAPHYDADWDRKWGDFSEWDHNQWYCLILAYGDYHGFCLEDFVVDVSQCIDDNCDIENALTGYPNISEELERLFKIQDYLREREEREYA